jgi:hypothetical protein
LFKKGLQRKKDLIHIIKSERGRNEIAQKVSKTSFKMIVSLTNAYLICVRFLRMLMLIFHLQVDERVITYTVIHLMH